MRELGGKSIFYKWGKTAVGTEITGFYVRSRVDKFGKTNWVLRSREGQEHSLNYSGLLENKIGYAEIGQELKVIYHGTEPVNTQYGVKDCHQFSVYCLSDEKASVDDMESTDTRTVRPEEARKDTLDDEWDMLADANDDLSELDV